MPQVKQIERRIKLHDLHALMTVAQAGSMGKGAHLLNTSQPAISRSISRILNLPGGQFGHPVDSADDRIDFLSGIGALGSKRTHHVASVDRTRAGTASDLRPTPLTWRGTEQSSDGD